ncbi:MAG: mycothiol conjugate amidase Mca [Propionibacteriaceae bacterium]|nr:mycothiol conjugate amidase Mca [Propionibacteriaceae bacterium]
MESPLRVDAAGEPLRAIFTHAHPDDESSKGAATMARYSREGARVVVVTLTGGERGEVLNPKLDRPEVWENLAQIRREEMDRAREILGVEQIWLGYEDSGFTLEEPWPPMPPGSLAATDPEVAGAKLAAIIRQIKPHVVVTYDEKGGYPHPDHIMTHRVTMAALAIAADPARDDVAGQPWETPKVYYHMGMHRARFARLDELMHEHGLESPYAERLANWPDDDEMAGRLTTFVPAADYFEVRDDALRAHATQIDPDGFWFAVPLEIQKKGWPTEDYELVSSLVETSVPEDDLFAGLAFPCPASADDWRI